MLRLMLMGDKMIGGKSAYSKVMYELATRLAKVGYPVAHIPMGMANQMGIQTYENNLRIYTSGSNPFGEDVAVSHYLEYKADMLITLKEPWVFSRLYNEPINFTPVCPIDHSPVSAGITSRLHTAFKVIAISRFGQRELKNAGLDSVYMPHGVKTEVYKPMPKRKKEFRKAWFLDEDAFIIGVVAMNRARKKIDRMLRGYKLFRERNPDVKSHLMLWTNVRPPRRPEEMPLGLGDQSVDLVPEVVRLGLMEHVTFPDEKTIGRGIPEWTEQGKWDMVKLYNCFDVLLLCTGGEGFGLPLIEAQSVGVPVLTTDYAAGPELVGAGLTVPWYDYDVSNTPGTRYALVSLDKMADALAKIYNADREKLAKKARAFALRYDWNRVVEDYLLPFLDSCELELKPKWTAGGLETWA
jgi:glycosyltransferase involved in cell wall biosynthesis